MTLFDLPDSRSLDGVEDVPLVHLSLFMKAVTEAETDDVKWRFHGVASDESEDVDGDAILKKALDLSYAQQRGFVNWDHSRAPRDQIGYLTKATLITKGNREGIERALGKKLETGASVFVEGELYKGVERAAEVRNIMAAAGESPGLGLSLDGALARDVASGGVVKAFVRGVAITPVPAQAKTLIRLRKSLMGYEAMGDSLPADLPAEIAGHVIEELEKSGILNRQVIQGDSPRMSFDQAVLWVLKKRPKWSFEIASNVVRYTMQAKPDGEPT